MEPNKQLAMKQENTVPKGMEEPAPYCEAWMAALIAGGHCRTKMYIAPEKRKRKNVMATVRHGTFTADIITLAEAQLQFPIMYTQQLYLAHKVSSGFPYISDLVAPNKEE